MAVLSSRFDWLCFSGGYWRAIAPAITVNCHWWGLVSAPSLNSTIHSCPGSFVCLASCWWLGLIGSMVFHLPHWSGSSSPSGPGVSLLPICYWLGVPLHCSSYSCPECHNTADPFGYHQVGCGSNGDSITRHNAIRDVIFIVLPKFAALAPVKEMPNLNSDSLKTLLMSSHLEPWPASCSWCTCDLSFQQKALGEAAST